MTSTTAHTYRAHNEHQQNGTDEPVLVVDRLSITSPGRSLVSNVSFTLHAGERVGLIGESGSGKSLTSLAILGLLPDNLKSSGSVTFSKLERDIVGASEREMSRIRGLHMSMVFQEPMTALDPTMKIGKQVAEILYLHNKVSDAEQARARTLELLTRVNLPDPERMYGSYPHQLSGGQRQRVVLAIAIANAPSLLICDEPTTALDVTVQARMLALIGDVVAENNSALLFITHDLAVVATICERIIVMYGGEMLENGRVRDVLTAPQHPYTRGLLAASDLETTDERGRLMTLSPTVFDYRERYDLCAYCNDPDRDPADPPLQSRWVESDGGGYACWHENASTEENAA